MVGGAPAEGLDGGRGSDDAQGMDVDTAITELRAIERRFAPPSGSGPEAFRAQLADWRARQPDTEFRLTIGDSVGEAVFSHLCARYGIVPFRRPRQQSSTVTVLAPRGFVEGVLSPQFEQMIDVVDRAMHATVEKIFLGWAGPPKSG